ncbi:hypothetical protein [Trueperella sp. LYQ141]|uniref:hypothetical protein n=1 Tax=Trueperella sp. LYQ141 TaxID=3391058 RepID=UPI003983ABF8
MSLATCALVAPSIAYAFQPAQFDTAIGEGGTAAIAPSVTHSEAKDASGNAVSPVRQPTWGDYVDYTYTWEFANLNEPGSAQKPVDLVISFPQGLAPTTDVTEADFTLPDGWQITNLTKQTALNYTASIQVPSSAHNGTVTLVKRTKIPAKGAAGAPAEGATLWASSMAQTSAAPDITLMPGNYYFVPDSGNPCVGTFTYQWKTTSGAWLADIKIGDAAGRGKIVLDDAAPTAGTGPNSLSVTDAQGRDISAQVVGNMASWKSNDNSAPFQGNPYQAQYPNTKWKQSANWRIDTSTFTGDTWIPANSTVTLRKHGQHLNCVAGIATDWQSDRPVIAALEVTRPILDVQETATDPLQLPGTPPETGAWCQNDLYYIDRFNMNPRDWGTITLTGDDKAVVKAVDTTKTPKQAGSTTTVDAFYTSVAASDKFYKKLYFVGSATKGANAGFTGLIEYDMQTKKYRAVASSPEFNPRSQNTLAIGFDNHGTIWATYGTHVGTADAIRANNVQVYKIDMTKPNPRWEFSHTIKEMGIGNMEPLDIAFDAWDNAYVTTSSPTSDGQGKLVRWTKDEWYGASASHGSIDVGKGFQPKNWNKSMYAGTWKGDYVVMRDYEKVVASVNISGGQNYRGLAFGPDGNLYLGQQGKQLWRVDLINHDTGELLPEDQRIVHPVTITQRSTILAPVQSGNVYSGDDLAGCHFGKIAGQPDQPKFKLQKSVIDPATGIVVTPGRPAMNPLSLNGPQPFTVRYVVTVSNIGQAAGTPGQITDSISIPDGFTIRDVLVDGKSQGTSGQFTITPGQIAASGVEKHDIVLKLSADIPSVNWEQAQTCGAMNGTYGGGFYNQVAMDGDSDGPSNNYACVPTQPSAHLALKKFIRLPGTTTDVDPSSPFAADSAAFTLGAGLIGGGAQVTGSSAYSGELAVDTNVPAGTYQLFETPNDDGKITGAYTWGTTWSCTDQNGAAVSVTDNGQVAVKSGQSVTCEIRNQPPTKVHVVKTPTQSVGTNPHIGDTIIPGENGRFTASYDIAITNTSGFTVDTGMIRDQFTVPAGLVWDTETSTTATLQVVSSPDGVTVDSLATDLTEDKLKAKEGAALADIKGLANDGNVVLRLTIPLKLDNSSDSQNNAQSHAQQLGRCENLETSGQKHTSKASGIANSVDLDNEDLKYSAIPIADNIACIPVRVPPPFTPELPSLPLTGGGSARDLFILTGMALAVLGGVTLISTSGLRRVVLRTNGRNGNR